MSTNGSPKNRFGLVINLSWTRTRMVRFRNSSFWLWFLKAPAGCTLFALVARAVLPVICISTYLCPDIFLSGKFFQTKVHIFQNYSGQYGQATFYAPLLPDNKKVMLEFFQTRNPSGPDFFQPNKPIYKNISSQWNSYFICSLNEETYMPTFFRTN